MSKSWKIIFALLMIMFLIVVAGCNSDQKQDDSSMGQSVADHRLESGEEQGISSVQEEEKPLSVSILSVTSPASPGGTPVTVFARTQPGVVCEIEVGYDGGENEAAAFTPKQAQENGLVSWTWKVNPSTPFGKYPVTVTAKRSNGAGQPVSAVADIEIKSAEECKK